MMACLTQEQLAALALGLEEGKLLSAHIDDCATCRTALSDMQHVTERLSAVHAELGRTHAASRERLMANLPTTIPRPAQREGARIWLGRQLERLTVAQRIAVGGIGLTTVTGFALLLLALTSTGQLSAMERMAKAVREVKSYSYKLFTQDTFVRKGDTHPSTVIHTGTTYWTEPRSLFYDETLVKFEGTAPQSEDKGKLLTHLTGIHPTGKPGLFIHHSGASSPSMAKTYWWVPPLPSMRAEDIGKDSPITRLRMVREGAGKVLRELGTKVIDGKQARGYIMALSGAKPGSGFDELEVWVDPETDLPLEFGYQVKDEKLTQVFRITDCRWNVEIDPQLFDTTPPQGYTDITPPSDEKDLADMASALKLYAELSGGRYPQVSTFDADVIHDEMLNMSGFTATPREELNEDPKFRKIQDARSGLNWIARVLRHKFNACYYGQTVGPADKDKALLWWMADLHAYRVFYGDLRTELLPLRKWAKVVPAEAASWHLPENE
jgi:outer membrane lipoprotein-sorting protein